MPRPRTPTSILQAQGSFVNHSNRKAERAAEPQPTGPLGNAPKAFTKEQRKIWKELVVLSPPGVLTNADRWTVELVCKLMAKLRDDTIKPPEMSLLLNALGRLGMTPSDRSKVAVAPTKKKSTEEDPWAAFDKVKIAEA